MALHYSKHFGVTHKALVSQGVYNGYLDRDSLLHVDPLLLKDCKIPEFKNAYENFLQYFKGFVSLTKFVTNDNFSDRFFKKMVERFTLSEIPNTGLGYSISNTRGRGISGALSIQLAKSAYDIIRAGIIDPEIFELMPLIEDNMGADRISDMILSILRKNFLQYTQRVSKELGISIEKYRFDGVDYEVPYYRNKPVHFIPMEFLADLPIARDYDDIDKVCNYNNELKKRVAKIIGVTWSQYKDYKKTDWKQIILTHRNCYDTVINFYKGLTGVAYDFTNDSKDQYKDMLLTDFLAENPFECPKLNDKTVEEEVYNLTMAMCKQFKHLIEDNRLSELFYRKGRTPDETDWQMLFYTVADTYKEAAHLNIAITREDNPGVGEIDFHITRGSQANTVIEIKRSDNANLIHGYRTQLAAYMNAEKAKSGIFMVIMEGEAIDSIKKKIADVQADMLAKDEYIPEVIYVNGKKQLSASNSKYINPSLDK